MKKQIFLIPIFLIFILTGCSTDPDETILKKEIASYLENRLNVPSSIIILNDFRVINREFSEKNGKEIQTIRVSYKLNLDYSAEAKEKLIAHFSKKLSSRGANSAANKFYIYMDSIPDDKNNSQNLIQFIKVKKLWIRTKIKEQNISKN